MNLKLARTLHLLLALAALGFVITTSHAEDREPSQDIALVKIIEVQSARYFEALTDPKTELDPSLVATPKDLPEVKHAALLVDNLWKGFQRRSNHKDLVEAKLDSIVVFTPHQKMNLRIVAVEIGLTDSQEESGSIDIAWVQTADKSWKLIEL